MKSLTSWLKRKKANFCILAGICSLSLFVILNSGEKIKENTGGFYVIKLRIYGLDAAEMERSVTVPLEDALFAISGVTSVQSSTENSLSRIFVSFRKGEKGRYEAVRDAAQRVYESLPSSAQRPEILSSNNSLVPVWSASVFTDNNNNVEENVLAAQILEKIVKPRFESLDGAGEVLVSGVGLKEIVIILDQEKLMLLGLEPSVAADTLGMNDSIFSGGTIRQQDREIIITVDGRYSMVNSAGSHDASSLENALIPLEDGKFIRLSQIALITEQERMPEILSRLNGRKTAGIAIMGRYGADLRKLSFDIKKELSAMSLPLEFTVLSDLGAEEAAAFRSVFNAALSGAIMVAIISILLNRKKSSGYSGIFCALSIPFICLFSVAILSTVGFSIDKLLLAGIAAGMGTAVDAVILCSEKLRKCVNYNAASAALSELAGPLIAGAATTIAALLPLLKIEEGGAGIIASGISMVTLTALIMSLTLLPPLLLWGMNSRRTNRPSFLTFSLLKINILLKRAYNKFSRICCRLLVYNVKYCTRYPVLILLSAFLLTASAIFVLVIRGVDTSSYGSEDSLYAQVEFDGGLLAEETDRFLASYGENLAHNNGIKNVETGARTGSGSLLISFDPKQIKPHFVKDLAKQTPIPGGFVFFHENTKKDRYWEIFIHGDEDQKCRELAEELSFICAGHPLIRECVLNFKQGSKKLVLLPDRELLAESGISFSDAASRVRLGVYGPVIYKRIDSEGETDVRIRTGGINNSPLNVMRQSKEGTLSLLIPSGNEKTNSSLRIDSITNIREEYEPSSIKRIDRRRTASITIITKPIDPRHLKQELDIFFKKLNLPSGYSLEFDPDAIKQAQTLSSTILSLIIAVAFCYMIIASINESFTIPLFVLSSIPPSLAIPALCLSLSGSSYNSSIACAFIAVSGMTVNSAVLCVDGLRNVFRRKNKKLSFNIYHALRGKMPVLLSTTGTTVAGAIPFLFLTENANTLIRTLSIVGALGVACSCFCSITVIPSLLISFNKKSFRLCGI